MDAVTLKYRSHLGKFLLDFNMQYLYKKRFCLGCTVTAPCRGWGEEPPCSFPHTSAFALGRGEGRTVPLQL